MKPITVLVAALALAASAQAKTARFAGMSAAQWVQFNKGESRDLTVEFRSGDRLPVSIDIKSDLITVTDSPLAAVTVQCSFWIRMENGEILMSLDGEFFRPLGKVVGGALSLGAGTPPTGGLANQITIGLETHLK